MSESTARLRSLVRNSGAYTSVTLLRAVLMVAVLPLLTRLLPVTEYAMVALLTPVWWIGQSVLSLGASEGIARAVTGRPRSAVAGAYLGCVVIVFLTSGLALCVAPAASETILGLPWSRLVFYTLALAGLQSLVSICSAALRGQRRVSSATTVMATAAIGAPISGLFAAAYSHSAEGYTAGMCAAAAVATLIGAGFLVLGVRVDLTGGAAAAAFSVRLGLPGLPQAGALLVLDAGLRRATLDGQGPQGVAVYGLAAATGGLLWTVVRSAGLAWGPEIYTYNDGQVGPAVREQVRLFVSMTTIFAGLGVAIAPFAARLLLPDAYPISDFAPLVAVFLLSGVIGVPFVALLQLSYRGGFTTVLPIATIPVVAVVLGAVWRWRSVLPVELIAAGQPLALGLIVLGLWIMVLRRTGTSIDAGLWWMPVFLLAVVATVVYYADSPLADNILGAGLVAFGAILGGVSVGRQKNA